MTEHSSQFEEGFVKFTKHIPRILRKQILADFVNQLVESSSQSATSESGPSELSNAIVDDSLETVQDTTVSIHNDPKACCRPTIERFHGTLLFVDISGSTILSQKFDLTFINLFNYETCSVNTLIDCANSDNRTTRTPTPIS